MVILGFLALLNVFTPIYHKLEGHSKRMAHSGLASVVFFLVIGVGGVLTYLASNSFSGTLATSPEDIAFLAIAPYYILATLLIIGGITSSFFYENWGKLSFAIPGLFILLALLLMGSHYIETDSAVKELEDHNVSPPFNETPSGYYSKQLAATKTSPPPVNKVYVGLGTVSHLTIRYNQWQDLLSTRLNETHRYSMGDCTPENAIDGKNNLDTVIQTWKFFIEGMNHNSDLVVEMEMKKCGPNCTYSKQQVERSFEQFYNLEKDRIEAAQNILNAPDHEFEACKLSIASNNAPVY